ncbi:cysteine desulfurase family protein [Azospirillum griseum]|uniref:Cysteine desulfurase n=2 Tax=Azospirillum griseum TaxID=2496639 RepID=A0A3S0HZK5_9PROT|nr:cysteine desulfurase family protein [Azospirillum griseum]RTR22945.1 cysteine desulfurase [Azospirillum griseum]
MTTTPIYLDHLASAPLAPAVLDAMLPWLSAAAVGNPHAAHRPGWRAAEAIDAARAEVAALVGAPPGAVLFTSGATEANTLALLGAAAPGGACVLSAVEHASALGCAPELRRRGHPVILLAVDGDGRVDPDRLADTLARQPAPALVSIMAANNEVGTRQPLAELAAVTRARGGRFHSDAAQAAGWGMVEATAMGLDLVSLSGHKLGGPMGIGALVVGEAVPLRPPSPGGGQQRGLRPGTLPTALCVGFGVACRLARAHAAADARRVAALRDRLWARLSAALPGLRRNGAPDGLPGCLSVALPGLDAADLLLGLPDLAAATGSACHSDAAEPSHVLRALGRSAEEAHGTLRFGLGRTTTAEEVERAAAWVIAAIHAGSPDGFRDIMPARASSPTPGKG